jgi:hypothetical protein
MTRQHHHQHDSTSISHRGQVASLAPSPAWLGIDIALRSSHLGGAIASMTRQHHHKHDSVTTSRRGQVTSVAPSPTWLDIDITLRPSHLDSAITSMTRHRHRVMAKLPWQHHCQHDSVTLSLAWLGKAIVSMTQHQHHVTAKSPQQHHRQHESASISQCGQVTSATPSLAWLGIYFMLWLNRRHQQQHMISVASRHAANL